MSVVVVVARPTIIIIRSPLVTIIWFFLCLCLYLILILVILIILISLDAWWWTDSECALE
jgi:hypothetical protein